MSFITHNLRQLQESVVTVLQNRAAQPSARPRQRVLKSNVIFPSPVVGCSEVALSSPASARHRRLSSRAFSLLFPPPAAHRKICSRSDRKSTRLNSSHL